MMDTQRIHPAFSAHRLCATALLAFVVLTLVPAAEPSAGSGLASLTSMAYVLQADGLARTPMAAADALARCDRDLIVIDPFFDGPQSPWTTAQLRAIRAGRPGRCVVAYLSIGEAEDYRAYWRKSWDANRDGKPDPGAPAFLLGENPDWKGNYRVKYWESVWQRIVLAEIDQIVKQGFDGIYLDIVDAFETFEYDPRSKDWLDDRLNPATGATYRRDMVAWVKSIAAHARKSRGEFRVIPQNGEALLVHADYLQAIDAIGVEDLFTTGNKINKSKEIEWRMGFLARAKPAGKPVWTIEYPVSAKARQAAADSARRAGFRCLLTDRQLKTLGKMAGQ